MKIELDFNSKTFRKAYSLNFDMLWKAKTNFSIGVIVWGLISTLLGYFVLIDKNQIGYIIILTSLLLIITAILFLLKQLRLRKRYDNGIENEIEEYNQIKDSNIIFEFTDTHFGYKDHKMDLKYTYVGMQGYRIAEDIILIDVSKERYITFAIGTEQLSLVKTEKLLELLKSIFPEPLETDKEQSS